MRSSLFAISLFAACFVLAVSDASGQNLNPRVGVGVNAMLSTADGFGIGFRGRASAPVNSDVSLGLDAGFTGFVLGGRRDASYVFDPQFSVIVNVPESADRLAYLLFGVGAYVPIGATNSRSGPTIHVGYGRIQVLQETSLFYEVNPALVIAEDRVDIAVPVRIGIIF